MKKKMYKLALSAAVNKIEKLERTKEMYKVEALNAETKNRRFIANQRDTTTDEAKLNSIKAICAGAINSGPGGVNEAGNILKALQAIKCILD